MPLNGWRPLHGGLALHPPVGAIRRCHMDKEQICADLTRVREDFRELVDTATVAEIGRAHV